MKLNLGSGGKPLSGYLNFIKNTRDPAVDVICDMDRYPGNKTVAEIWNPQETEMPAPAMARRIRDTLSYNSWYHAVKALSIKGLPVSKLNIVEVGCGTGTGSLTFGLLGASVTLIDSNERVLDQTKKIYERFRCPARFIRTDCLDPLPEGTEGAFDLALSSGLAEHFTGGYRQRCIDYHRALLKPGGMAMIGVPNSMSPFYQWIRGFRILTGTWGPDVEVPFTNRELRALAQQGGFKKYYVLGATSLFRDSRVYSRGFVSAVADLCPGALRKAARKWKASGEDKAFFPSDPVNYSVELCRAAQASVEGGRYSEPRRMLANWLSSGLTLVAFR